MNKPSKTEIKKNIEEFFKDIEKKSVKEIKKIKKLAMSQNIKLGEKRKLFCRKCFKFYKTPKIRINKNIKTTICENCGKISKWKIKN